MTDKKQFELTDDQLDNVTGGTDIPQIFPAFHFRCDECKNAIMFTPHNINGKVVCDECAEKLTK